MEWPIKANFGAGIYLDAFFTIRHNGPDIYIEFTDNAGGTLVIDNLSSFHKIVFDDFDPLHMTFIGPSISRSFKFTSEDAVSNVWAFLQENVKLSALSDKYRTFMISPKNENLTNPIKDFIPSFLKQSDPIHSSENSRPSEAITSGLIQQSLSELVTVPLDENSFSRFFTGNSLKDSSCHIHEFEISQTFLPELWKRLLSVSDESLDDAQILLSQLNPIDRDRWNRFEKLRTFVYQVETRLSRNHYSYPNIDTMIFNILIGIFSLSSRQISFDESYFTLAELFVFSYIATIDSDGTVHTNEGDCYSLDEAQKRCFNLFVSFFNQYIDSTSSQYKLIPFEQVYSKTMDLLDRQSPTTSALFRNFKINDFEFIKSFALCFFIIGRDIEDGQLMLTDLMTTKDPKKFLPSLIAAISIMLQGRLSEIAPGRTELFEDFFIGQISLLNFRLVLFNTDNLINFQVDESSC